jgi:hypothetical protein
MSNKGCISCDYYTGCHKKIIGVGLAKEQPREMKCVCIVHDICRDCKWFSAKKCASWKILNGKRVAGILTNCPKKVKING